MRRGEGERKEGRRGEGRGGEESGREGRGGEEGEPISDICRMHLVSLKRWRPITCTAFISIMCHCLHVVSVYLH